MNHHKTLGVEPSATNEEIRAAYRRLAMKHHPDRPGGDHDKFSEIGRAYIALQNAVCSVCGGKGHVREKNGAFVKTVPCPRCWNVER